jgi:T4 superinfection immunity protein
MALLKDDLALDRGVLTYTELTEMNVRQAISFEVRVTDVGKGAAHGAYVREANGNFVDPQDVPTGALVNVTASCSGNVTCTPVGLQAAQAIYKDGQSAYWQWQVNAVSPGTSQIFLTATTYDTDTDVVLNETPVTVDIAVNRTFSYSVDNDFDKAKTLILSVASGVAVVAGAIGTVLALRGKKKRKKSKAMKKAAAPSGTSSQDTASGPGEIEPAGALVSQPARVRPDPNRATLLWVAIPVGTLIILISIWAGTLVPDLGVIVFAILVVIAVIYYVPTIIAYVRRRPDLASIALFNVFLGWTIIGWIIAMVWCFRKPKASGAAQQAYEESPPTYTAFVTPVPQEEAHAQPPALVPPVLEISGPAARTAGPAGFLAVWQTPEADLTWQEPAGEWLYKWLYHVSLGPDSRPRFVLFEESRRIFAEPDGVNTAGPAVTELPN